MYVQLRLVRCNFPLRAYGNIFIFIIRKVVPYLIFYKTTEILLYIIDILSTFISYDLRITEDDTNKESQSNRYTNTSFSDERKGYCCSYPLLGLICRACICYSCIYSLQPLYNRWFWCILPLPDLCGCMFCHLHMPSLFGKNMVLWFCILSYLYKIICIMKNFIHV